MHDAKKSAAVAGRRRDEQTPEPMSTVAGLPGDYPAFLAQLKDRIAAAQAKAMLAVNSELIRLYWEIGDEILRREKREGWGAKVIDRLAADLRAAFPEMRGFSRANLHYMRSFAAAWPLAGGSGEIVQRPVGQLPWGQNIALLSKLADPAARAWYAERALANGWSRRVLEAQIATDLHGRQGNALTSFPQTLQDGESELVSETIKDPYNFEFLNLSERARERDLELALLGDVQSFLFEMGRGFALVGRQFSLHESETESGRVQEYLLDLLFYNYILRPYIVIDLKIEDFKPEFAGKMHFYLNAVDELERQPEDRPSIGLILCPGRNRTVTEWALRGLDAPIAVARYVTADMTLTQQPPSELRQALPELPQLAGQLAASMRAAR